MRVIRTLITLVVLAVWVVIMLFLVSTGTASEARLIVAMVMCTVLIVGTLSAVHQRAPEPADDRMPCPYCIENIKASALLCPHCRSDLKASEVWRLRPREIP